MSDITQAQADDILIPLQSADGAIIGAIGVSGSSVENDHTVASAVAAAQL